MWQIFPPKNLEIIRCSKIRMRRFFKNIFQCYRNKSSSFTNAIYLYYEQKSINIAMLFTFLFVIFISFNEYNSKFFVLQISSPKYSLIS